MDATKCVLPKDITIRVVNKTTGKVKNVFPNIANNKQLMKTSGQQIADPQYDAKMEAVKNNRPFIENGKAKEPVKESFAPQNEVKDHSNFWQTIKPEVPVQIEQPKACCDSVSVPCTQSDSLKLNESDDGKEIEEIKRISNTLQSNVSNHWLGNEVVDKPKRKRRTKEQMKQSKLQK